MLSKFRDFIISLAIGTLACAQMIPFTGEIDYKEELIETKLDVSSLSDFSAEPFVQALANGDFSITIVCNETKLFTFSLKDLNDEQRSDYAYYMSLSNVCVEFTLCYIIVLVILYLFIKLCYAYAYRQPIPLMTRHTYPWAKSKDSDFILTYDEDDPDDDDWKSV